VLQKRYLSHNGYEAASKMQNKYAFIQAISEHLQRFHVKNLMSNTHVSSMGYVKSCQVKVKVTLRPTVGQSVCLGIESTRDLRPDSPPPPSKLLSCLCGAPSLTRGRVCLLSMESIVVSQYLHKLFTLTIYIICVRHSSAMYNIYKDSFSPGSVQQIMP
jgi:hypothetical protein